MADKIKISTGSVVQTASLNESECAKGILGALPLEAEASVWGEEIYFQIPVKCSAENPQTLVELGDLGYWPDGSCFCIFFGPTPMSLGDEIRPASAVQVFGRLDGNPKEFKRLAQGVKVTVEIAQ